MAISAAGNQTGVTLASTNQQSKQRRETPRREGVMPARKRKRRERTHDWHEIQQATRLPRTRGLRAAASYCPFWGDSSRAGQSLAALLSKVDGSGCDQHMDGEDRWLDWWDPGLLKGLVGCLGPKECLGYLLGRPDFYDAPASLRWPCDMNQGPLLVWITQLRSGCLILLLRDARQF